MQIISTIREMQKACRTLKGARTLGLVPTMGALHDGHRSLLRRARAECDVAVMSLFVNPTQFNDREDFAKYPRDAARDLQTARQEGVDIVFAPSAEAMYPAGFETTVHVATLAAILEGASRPGHFDGVATVVAKLLLASLPTRAYFGRKDYQQLQVIRRMGADLGMPAEIVACETMREPDGLAMSSRNVRLSPAERSAATVLNAALVQAAEASRSGASVVGIEQQLSGLIGAEPLAQLDYAVVVDADTLQPVVSLANGAVALVAARFGAVRLIDNGELPTPSI